MWETFRLKQWGFFLNEGLRSQASRLSACQWHFCYKESQQTGFCGSLEDTQVESVVTSSQKSDIDIDPFRLSEGLVVRFVVLLRLFLS